MSRRSQAIELMPSVVLAQLRQLGEDMAIARKRRKESRKAWAQRLGVSEPTVTRMESGDPSVSMGIYASALWLIGRSQGLVEIASPELDEGALEDAVRAARSRSVRKKPSVQARLDAAGAGFPGKRGSAP